MKNRLTKWLLGVGIILLIALAVVLIRISNYTNEQEIPVEQDIPNDTIWLNWQDISLESNYITETEVVDYYFICEGVRWTVTELDANNYLYKEGVPIIVVNKQQDTMYMLTFTTLQGTN